MLDTKNKNEVSYSGTSKSEGGAKSEGGNCAPHKIRPATEDKYWSENYKSCDYVNPRESYDTYRLAYRHGIEAFLKHNGQNYDAIAPQIEADWNRIRSDSYLPWDKAEPAVRDAYKRLADLPLSDEE